MISKKYKKIINFVIGPALFIILAFSIYRKLIERGDLASSWDNIRTLFHTNRALLSFLFALMLLNWGLETYKWKILISPVQKISFWKGFKGILSGLSFSLFLPNGSGDYIGRMLFLDEGKKLRSLPVSFVGSLSQLLVTLICGIIGIIYLFTQIPAAHEQMQGLSHFWVRFVLVIVSIGVILILIMYYKISLFTKLLLKIPLVYKKRIFIEALEQYDWKILTKVFFLSIIRYSVFLAQYLLVFYLLGINLSIINVVMGTCALFFVLAIIPTIPFVDVGIRGQASIQVFGLMTGNIVGIVSAAVLIWIVNLILPSIIGSIFTLGVKMFKEK